MDSNSAHPVSHSKANRLGIRDLPTDVLVLIFLQLHRQDIARCMGVCRCFADLVHSDVYLQYRIELAHHGMVDGLSSALPVSERLQRLRQYSSNFRNGIFDHEDLTAHPDYVRQLRNLQWNMTTHSDGATSALYGDSVREYKCFLSVFTDGSAEAGIQSRRWLMPVGTPGDRTRWMRDWIIDGAQDLLVTTELAGIDTNPRMSRLLEVRFCSLSGSETTPMDHPAATLPRVQVFPPAGSDATVQIHILSLSIAARYVIWGLFALNSQVQNYSIHVCNWRTGQMISQIDLGAKLMNVVTLADSYLLVTPRNSDSEPHLNVYSLFPSVANRPLCTLQLPDVNLNPGERVVVRHMGTSRHPPAPEGHFRADPSMSMVVLTHYIGGPISEERTSHLLIPCAALLAQIHTVVASADSHEPPTLVPWKDWGPHASLQLRLRLGVRTEHSTRHISLIPYGSRMPVVGFEDPGCTRASVYVFDVNPLAARHARHILATQSESEVETNATTIVEDVEAALPGVVDPECAAIPFVVYRFGLPPSPPERRTWHAIRAVRMSMTGFTVSFGGIGFEETEQTWTV